MLQNIVVNHAATWRQKLAADTFLVLTNIKLGWKDQLGKNTWSTRELWWKKFYSIGPWAWRSVTWQRKWRTKREQTGDKVIKTFLFVTDGRAK